MHYNQFRYYYCDKRQYLCADPIGLLGGLNLYSYVQNPLKYIDPLGLCKDYFNRQKKILDNINASRNAGDHLTSKISMNGHQIEIFQVTLLNLHYSQEQELIGMVVNMGLLHHHKVSHIEQDH